MSWVVSSFNMHVLYDTKILELEENEETEQEETGTPGIEYKGFQSPLIDTVMMHGSGPVPATISTDIKGELTGDKRYNMKITWKAGLPNDCVFKIWVLTFFKKSTPPEFDA